jgi:4-cresol dehydrogenase (hydroxylating)
LIYPIPNTALSDRLETAVARWRKILSPMYVLTGDSADVVMADTDWRAKCDYVVLKPADRDEVRMALAIAAEMRVPVHPVSTGRNWGYGSGRPPESSTRVILHLGRLDRIVDFDSQKGLVTLEPGVTQGVLARFLECNGARFMTPTTGAGPGCSVIGNALERGYGLTPYADHFAAVMGIEAVLPDGQIYRSPLATWGDDAAPLGHYKWGCGPYLDGLFSQGAFGVVTRMTIALARRPARVESFYFWIDHDDGLEAAVNRIQDLLASAGGPIGGINLVSAERLNLMVKQGSKLPRAAWIGTGALYGDRCQVLATRKSITSRLGPVSKKILFLNRDRLRLAERLEHFASSFGLAPSLRQLVRSTADVLGVLEGKPSEFALPLAYAAHMEVPEHDLDPARDGCGLLWYAPVVPMEGSAARRYYTLATRICSRYGFKPAVTFSSISPIAFDSTLPLIFEATQEGSSRAHTCMKELIQQGKEEGFFPYRYGAASMAEAVSSPDVFWRLATDLKRTVDPNGIISPGRYHRS